MKDQHYEYCENKHNALSAGGRVWNKYPQKIASYKELIHHNIDKINTRQMTGGGNEFG